jgi:pimeloyl-ACP methyl ester carboxylesterase
MHPIRMQLEYFKELAPLLARSFTVFAVDLPGHGGSSIDREAAYDEPYLRRSIVDFIERLDLRSVTLAGESIGAVLALTVAASLPDRVKAVVASNTYDYDQYYGDGVRRGNLLAYLVVGSFSIPVVGAVNAALENPVLLGPILRGGLYDKRKLSWDLLRTVDRAGRRRGFRSVERKVFAGWRSWSEARRLYREVKAPVTLIYGEQDWSRPAERQATRAALPAAKLITLERTGHFATLERPREIASAILETLR